MTSSNTAVGTIVGSPAVFNPGDSLNFGNRLRSGGARLDDHQRDDAGRFHDAEQLAIDYGDGESMKAGGDRVAFTSFRSPPAFARRQRDRRFRRPSP